MVVMSLMTGQQWFLQHIHNGWSRRLQFSFYRCNSGPSCSKQDYDNPELQQKLPSQHAKKVLSNSPGLVDFAIGLVNSVLYLPDGQMKLKFKLQKNCGINLLIKTFLGLVEMIFGLVNVSFSMPEWQAVKMTFFAPRFKSEHLQSRCLSTLLAYNLMFGHSKKKQIKMNRENDFLTKETRTSIKLQPQFAL